MNLGALGMGCPGRAVLLSKEGQELAASWRGLEPYRRKGPCHAQGKFPQWAGLYPHFLAVIPA